MKLTPEAVAAERDWVRARASVVVPPINRVRANLGEVFDTEVGHVTEAQYRTEVDAVFTDGDLAVNVAGIVVTLRELDVTGDYPGFVVDEILGRTLAGMLAGTQPRGLLGEATYHYADLLSHGADGEAAGLDDLDAALAAGFQTRLPGWEWTERESPFTVG